MADHQLAPGGRYMSAEAARAYRRAYHAAHRDRVRGWWRRRRQAHPEAARFYNARRRARVAGASGSHTAAEWRAEIAWWGGRCAYCGRSDRPLTQEHVVSIARGGSDDIANIVPACGPCNTRKNAQAA